MATKKLTMEGKPVTFTVNAPSARKVSVAGDFNSWNKDTSILRKGKDNLWKRSLTLRPGRYQYKFVVDGNWISDPSNNSRVSNNYGTENSIIEVRLP